MKSREKERRSWRFSLLQCLWQAGDAATSPESAAALISHLRVRGHAPASPAASQAGAGSSQCFAPALYRQAGHRPCLFLCSTAAQRFCTPVDSSSTAHSLSNCLCQEAYLILAHLLNPLPSPLCHQSWSAAIIFFLTDRSAAMTPSTMARPLGLLSLSSLTHFSFVLVL